MINPSELTDFDYQILEKVFEYAPINEASITAMLPEQKAVSLRLKLLSSSDKRYSEKGGFSFPIAHTRYLRLTPETSCYEITELGMKVLEDWRFRQNKEHKQKLEDRFWKTISSATPIVSLLAFIKAFWGEITGIANFLLQLARQLLTNLLT